MKSIFVKNCPLKDGEMLICQTCDFYDEKKELYDISYCKKNGSPTCWRYVK